MTGLWQRLPCQCQYLQRLAAAWLRQGESYLMRADVFDAAAIVWQFSPRLRLEPLPRRQANPALSLIHI